MKRWKFLLVISIILLSLALIQPSLAEKPKFSQNPDGFKVGQEVIWLYESRPGYSDVQRIPVTITKLGPKLVQIKVQKNNNEFVERWVNRNKLETSKR